MFDEQPDSDPHSECALEIKRLEAISAELLAALQAILDEAGNVLVHKKGLGTINRMAFFARAAVAKATA